MIQIKNKWIPFGSFKAMAIWPFLFVKGKPKDADIVHEKIHGMQQIEMLWVGFFVVYGICWLKELVHCSIKKDRGQIQDHRYRKRNFLHRVEHAIIFEREAYRMQSEHNYLRRRKFWAWLNF